jgi:hypothetical protein
MFPKVAAVIVLGISGYLAYTYALDLFLSVGIDIDDTDYWGAQGMTFLHIGFTAIVSIACATATYFGTNLFRRFD